MEYDEEKEYNDANADDDVVAVVMPSSSLSVSFLCVVVFVSAFDFRRFFLSCCCCCSPWFDFSSCSSGGVGKEPNMDARKCFTDDFTTSKLPPLLVLLFPSSSQNIPFLLPTFLDGDDDVDEMELGPFALPPPCFSSCTRRCSSNNASRNKSCNAG